jgi:hypothetical protein
VNGIVSAERVGASALSGVSEERIVDAVNIDAAPEVLELIERSAKLSRRQTSSFAHPRKGRSRLDMSDSGGPDAVSIPVRDLHLLGSRLVDQ